MMTCPSCGSGFDEGNLFCSGCGAKLPAIIKEQIKEELNSALKEIKTPGFDNILYEPQNKLDTGSKIGENKAEDLSYETDDQQKIEYKKLLKQVFADGHIEAEEVVILANKLKELKLDRNEALNLQSDVAKELGLNIDEEGDLAFSGIVLEINTNKGYFIDEMDDLEFRITNISDDIFEKAVISSYLMNLKAKEERSIGAVIKPSQRRTISLPFSHSRRGNEVLEICLNYFDSRGNPNVYKTEFRVRVLSREEEKAGAKSITISFAADKIMGNDFSNMAEILEKDKKLPADKRSSYEETEKQWKRLPVFFDEYETHRRRDELIITKKIREGEEKLREGLKLKAEAEKTNKGLAIEKFKSAFGSLNESKECFKKIRELDSEHAIALSRVKEIREFTAEIEKRIGILEEEPVVSSIKLSSGCLTINSLQKKIYLYSKDRVTIGKNSSNDMVLRLFPCQPKEEYPENHQKSTQISGLHAEIINKAGQFYLRDIGSRNSGSLNGTFIDGKRLTPLEDYLLKDNCRVNIAKVLDLECSFLGELRSEGKQSESLSSCFTVLGEMSDSCFGIDKKSAVDAIKIRRRNNYTDGEKYIILIREIKIGKSAGNGIVIDSNKVSDIHAKIFYRDNQYWIEDLNSKHGTRVNGQQVMPGNEVSLKKQAEVIIGDISMNFGGFE